MSRELPSTWKAQPSIIRKAAWVISVVPRSTEHAKVLNQRSYPLFKKAHKSEKLWYQGEIKSWQTVLANCMMVFANSPANHSEPLVWKSFTLHRTSGVPLVVCVRAQYQQSEMVSGYDEELRTGRLCPFPKWAQQDMVFSDSMLEGEKQPYQAQDILSACNLKKL